jgi:predicted transcriptional regulator YheO
MNELSIKLTKTDHAILESYKSFVEGLCDYLGTSYEIVLHSLEDMDKSVIKILNGFHTGRTEGAPITDLALEMLSRINGTQDMSYISYFSKNSKGEPLRSSTIAIKGEKGRIIGLVCINFYLNSSFNDVIRTFIPEQNPQSFYENENFANHTEDIIEEAVNQAKQLVLQNDSITISMKNREIVRELHKKGIFNLKDSVIRTAEYLGISKNTVYMHLRNLSSNDDCKSNIR